MESQAPAARRYQMVARAEAAEATGERILAAARTLFGHLPYDQVLLSEVALSASVTVRTVVRRFGSKEQLFGEVAARRARDIRALRDHVSEGDLEGALESLVQSYETWGDDVLHLLAQERRTDTIGDGVRSGREFHQLWVKRVFGPHLAKLPAVARNRRLAQLTAVTDVYTWKILRRDLGLSREEIAGSLHELISAIIG